MMRGRLLFEADLGEESLLGFFAVGPVGGFSCSWIDFVEVTLR